MISSHSSSAKLVILVLDPNITHVAMEALSQVTCWRQEAMQRQVRIDSSE